MPGSVDFAFTSPMAVGEQNRRRVLAVADSHSIPRESRERIGRLALIWNFKLRLLERQLTETVEALSRAGIEVVLLKGAALALTAYRGFADRPMADIDLLVAPADAKRAWELVQHEGWACNNSEHQGSALSNIWRRR